MEASLNGSMVSLWVKVMPRTIVDSFTAIAIVAAAVVIIRAYYRS